jgi:oxygen-independent coproporphyrinogen-3 oxidase
MDISSLAAAVTAPDPGIRRADTGDSGFGLYVHWPFCRAKCPYCDFNSHVAPDVDHGRWRRALLAELDHFAGAVERRPLGSIFFGGGTPSLMAPDTVAAVIESAAARFGLAPGVEITLEANPTSVEAARLRDFEAAGVNRASLGVQALDDAALRFLGREHTAAEALAAVDTAAGIFERYSFDLIYGRPGQTASAWAAELDAALAHADGHISVYQLTIEPGTRFHALKVAGRLDMPGDDRQARLFDVTQNRLARAGLPAYEISNHARPGAECRHNLVYWRSGDWIGIGPGAHGRFSVGAGRIATETARAPGAWLARVEQTGHGERDREVLTEPAQLEEYLLMGLRLTEGVSIARIERLAGRPLADAFGARLDGLTGSGLLSIADGYLSATDRGRRRLDSVLTALLA